MAIRLRVLGLIFVDLLLLLVVALPLGLLAGWAAARLGDPSGGESVANVFQDLLNGLLISLGPVLLAGAVHLLIVTNLPASWSRTRQRSMSLALLPVIPLTLALLGVTILAWSPVAIGFDVGLVVYGLIFRLPTDHVTSNLHTKESPSG